MSSAAEAPRVALHEHARFAPDPDGARRLLERLAEAGLDEAALAAAGPDARLLAWLSCTRAPYLAALAAGAPARLCDAARDPHLRREKPREVLAAELELRLVGATTEDHLLRGLREFRAREMLRLGARELGLGTPVEVGRELARLADVALDGAIRFHDAELTARHGEPLEQLNDGTTRRARFVVIGMGKLGGEELNFSSDIDLIYLYSSDTGGAGALALHDYFAQLARRITRAIGELTAEDHVFRVDLRLRPEGTRGPIVNSLLAAERYYETWGRPWERQAWLKARPSAGDLTLGDEAIHMLEPFVYPRATSHRVVREVEDLNRRIKQEQSDSGVERGFDVKLGAGGIREVEFFAQALQLVHGGKLPMLRERGTRRALERLFFAGLIAERERRRLADAYDFLRQVEHLLQLEAGRQTQKLPHDVVALGVLAARLGLADASELGARLAMHTDAVAEIFATLGTPAVPPPALARLLAPDCEDAPAQGALAELGFADPQAAAFHLGLLRRKPLSPFGPAPTEAGLRIAPVLLQEIAASPDPDQALGFLVDYLGGAGPWLHTLLDEDRPLLRLAVSLFGTSAFLGRAFAASPELTLSLVGGVQDDAPVDARLTARLAALPAGPHSSDDEALLEELSRARAEEVLRVALADIGGDLEPHEVARALSDLAEACVTRCFALVAAATTRRHGPLPAVAVLALGKLGARELSYASDLDLLFVHDGGLDAAEPAQRLAQRLVGALGAHLATGRLYEVDTRLRPSGQQGLLVSSLIGWRDYHAGAARLWERQALLKLRAVAGDATLGALVEVEARRFACTPREGETPERIAAAIATMRARMEKELAREREGVYDLKTGRGGLVDVDFALQFLQLVHGAARPELLVCGTLPALDAARAAGLLTADDHHALCDGHRFLRRLEDRLRIVHDRPAHALPIDEAEMTRLARRAGFPSAAALARTHRDTARDVRAAFLRVLGVPPEA